MKRLFLLGSMWLAFATSATALPPKLDEGGENSSSHSGALALSGFEHVIPPSSTSPPLASSSLLSTREEEVSPFNTRCPVSDPNIPMEINDSNCHHPIFGNGRFGYGFFVCLPHSVKQEICEILMENECYQELIDLSVFVPLDKLLNGNDLVLRLYFREALKKRLSSLSSKEKEALEPWKSHILENPYSLRRILWAFKLLTPSNLEVLTKQETSIISFRELKEMQDKERSLCVAAQGAEILPYVSFLSRPSLKDVLSRIKRPLTDIGPPLLRALHLHIGGDSFLEAFCEGVMLAALESTRPLSEMGQPLVDAILPLYECTVPRTTDNDYMKIVTSGLRSHRPLSEMGQPLLDALGPLLGDFLYYKSRVICAALEGERPLSDMGEPLRKAVTPLLATLPWEEYRSYVVASALKCRRPLSEMGEPLRDVISSIYRKNAPFHIDTLSAKMRIILNVLESERPLAKMTNGALREAVRPLYVKGMGTWWHEGLIRTVMQSSRPLSQMGRPLRNAINLICNMSPQGREKIHRKERMDLILFCVNSKIPTYELGTYFRRAIKPLFIKPPVIWKEMTGEECTKVIKMLLPLSIYKINTIVQEFKRRFGYLYTDDPWICELAGIYPLSFYDYERFLQCEIES